jgi:RNA polymerase sigma-70 factor (ECF subfamily)
MTRLHRSHDTVRGGSDEAKDRSTGPTARRTLPSKGIPPESGDRHPPRARCPGLPDSPPDATAPNTKNSFHEAVQNSRPAGSSGTPSRMHSDSNERFENPSAAQQRFLSLFLRSEREIFRYVAALVPNLADADDIVQQTALSLWEKFEAYDPAQPFTPWACRFALNKARQWIERRQRWQALLDHGLAEELEQRRAALMPEMERRLQNLEGCLGRLPTEQRSLVEGYYFRRDGVQHLAAHSGRTVAATYKLLQRIRQTLQACIERAGHVEGLVP